MAYFGHVMRDEKYQLIQLILQGKIDGIRGQGRRRTSWLKNIRQWERNDDRTFIQGGCRQDYMEQHDCQHP